MREQGTLLDAVGRAKHTLGGERRGGAAVTVHGECPVAGCRAMNVTTVSSGTTSIVCRGCGTAFQV